MGLWKQIKQAIVNEPVEIVKDAVGQIMEKGQQTRQQTNDPSQNHNSLSDFAKTGFRTPEDFAKYQGLSGEKDKIELELARKQLVREWGLDTKLESGMQKARMEYEEREKQRREIKEKEKEQKKAFEFEKKKQEDVGLKAAMSEASPETKAWGAG